MAKPGNKRPSRAGKLAKEGDKPMFAKGADGRLRFAKGHRKLGGYEKGKHYKRTPGIAKELMRQLVQYGLEYGKAWLEETAKRNPGAALDLLSKFAEYDQPKLSRHTLDGPDGGPVVVELVTVGALKQPEKEATVYEPALTKKD